MDVLCYEHTFALLFYLPQNALAPFGDVTDVVLALSVHIIQTGE